MDLETALARFDGVHVAELKEALAHAAEAPGGALEAACHAPHLAVAATWVVKALLEEGNAGHLDMERVFAALDPGAEWAVQLHLLQSVQHAPSAALDRLAVIEALCGAKRTLVQVWALDALVRLAEVRPELRAEALRRVRSAEAAKAASLRARARALQGVCAHWSEGAGG